MQFSLALAVNAVGFFASSQLAASLGEGFGTVAAMALCALSAWGLALLVLPGLSRANAPAVQ